MLATRYLSLMQPLFDRALITVCLLIGLMALIDTLALSIRTSGAVTKRLAVALALFNLIVIFARISNLIQAPIVGNMVDKTVVPNSYLHTKLVDQLLIKIRIIILATSVGTVVGALLTPTFIKIFSRMITIFEEVKTLPRTAIALLHPREMLLMFKCFTNPFSKRVLYYLSLIKSLPAEFLVLQVLVTAFYTVGVLSTIYAAALEPTLRATAVNLSGIVNGIATILLFILVDPTAALVTDQCINNKRPVEHSKAMNLYLALAKFLGTILAQFIIIFTAKLVLWAAHFVNLYF